MLVITFTDVLALVAAAICIATLLIDTVSEKYSPEEINDRGIIRTGLLAVLFAALIIVQSRQGITVTKIIGLASLYLYLGMVWRRLTR